MTDNRCVIKTTDSYQLTIISLSIALIQRTYERMLHYQEGGLVNPSWYCLLPSTPFQLLCYLLLIETTL